MMLNLLKALREGPKITLLLKPPASQQTSSSMVVQYEYDSPVLAVNEAERQLLLYLPEESSVGYEWVSQGSTVHCQFVLENGMVAFAPTISHFVLKGTPQMWVDLPEDFEHIQRRQYVRIQHYMPLKVEILSHEGLTYPAAVGGLPPELPTPLPTKVLRVDQCPSVDVSAGGLRLFSKHPMHANQLVRVQFTLGTKLGLLSLYARVVYSLSVSASQSGASAAASALSKDKKPYPYQVALQFVGLAREQQQAILQECFQLELDLHRKGLV
jgi:c-di-GMP-binding flagellar brake protein YcgR